MRPTPQKLLAHKEASKEGGGQRGEGRGALKETGSRVQTQQLYYICVSILSSCSMISSPFCKRRACLMMSRNMNSRTRRLPVRSVSYALDDHDSISIPCRPPTCFNTSVSLPLGALFLKQLSTLSLRALFSIAAARLAPESITSGKISTCCDGPRPPLPRRQHGSGTLVKRIQPDRMESHRADKQQRQATHLLRRPLGPRPLRPPCTAAGGTGGCPSGHRAFQWARAATNRPRGAPTSACTCRPLRSSPSLAHSLHTA